MAEAVLDTAAQEESYAARLRQRWAGRRAEQAKQSAGKSEAGALASLADKLNPAIQTTNFLLRQSWYLLIPTWGLTIIYIDIHVFLHLVLGKKFFCSLGEEWTGIGDAKKTLKIVEPMGALLINLVYFTIVFAALAVIIAVASWMTASTWEQIKLIWGMGWSGISALVDIFLP